MGDIFGVGQAAFGSYAFYAALVVFKMMCVGLLTTLRRISAGVSLRLLITHTFGVGQPMHKTSG